METQQTKEMQETVESLKKLKEAPFNEKKKRRGLLSFLLPIGLIQSSYTSSKIQTLNSLGFLKTNISRLATGTKNIKQKQDEIKDGAFEEFDNVLSYWGIKRTEIPRIQRQIIFEIVALIACVAGLLYGMLIAPSNLIFFELCLAVFACGFRILERIWKFWIFKNVKHVTFKDWLLQKY